MKTHRESWATRKLPPITSERIEIYLDLLARLMNAAGKDAELYLPVWRRTELELQKQREAEAIMAAARARLTRSMDRTAEQSS